MALLKRTSPAEPPPQAGDYLLAEQVALLYRSARELALAATLTMLLLSVVQSTVIPLAVIMPWAAYMVVVTLLRALITIRYRRAADRDTAAGAWGLRYATGAALFGAGWGAAGVFLYPADSPAHQMFVLFVLGGMAAGSVVALSPRFEAFLAFFIPALVPAIVNLFLGGAVLHLTMGVMTLLFAVTLVLTAWRTHMMLARSLKLRHRNDELVARVSDEKEKAELLNDELKQEIRQREETEAALRQSQEQLVQSQKMEAVGQLAGGIAHDFNNLLQIIGGYGQLLTLAPELPASLHTAVRQITEATDRARGLTMKLLAFSRRQVLQTSPVDLNDVVSTLAPWLARLIGEHIQLRTELAPELGQVLGDSLQLEQVLMNLAVNAKDAMPHGGTLTISTANVELDGGFVASHRGARAGPHVCLRVQDTGHGIDADTMPRIFEPFYTTKPVGQGTGLGLAVVYGIAKQSSGYIDVESRPGEGAAFSLYLPRLTGTAMPEAVEEPDTEPGRGHESILVVEDEPAVRTLLANVLRHQGYAVREAGNGEEGLEAAGQSAPALLVTDLVMPRMGGFELARRLRDRYPGVKILYMTGYGDEDRIGSQQTDPKAPQLQKPFGPDVLARKVREILDDAIAAP